MNFRPFNPLFEMSFRMSQHWSGQYLVAGHHQLGSRGDPWERVNTQYERWRWGGVGKGKKNESLVQLYQRETGLERCEVEGGETNTIDVSFLRPLNHYGFSAAQCTGCFHCKAGAPVTCVIAPVESLCVSVIARSPYCCCVTLFFPAAALHHKAAQWTWTTAPAEIL